MPDRPRFAVPRRRALHLLALLPAFAAWRTAAAAAAPEPVLVEGYRIDARVTLAQTELVLNGIGLRAVAWLKGYVAALYLTRKATTTAAVLATPGPKRLLLRMLLDVPAAEFVKAFEKGVARNVAAAAQPALRERMQRFDEQVAAVGSVRKGDLVELDFVPGQGMRFTLNGRARGAPIAGDDFFEAMLLVFLGDKPTDRELKTGLLGGPIG